MSVRSRKPVAVTLRPSELPLSMPLINSVSLFTTAAWVETFRFIHRMVEQRGKPFNAEPLICITVNHLYVRKCFGEGEFRGFDNAQKLLTPFANVLNLTEMERNDRSNELSLSLKLFDAAIEGRLYEFRGSVCFSLNGAVAVGSSELSRGTFQQSAARWNMKAGKFLEFLLAIEKALMGCGDTLCCRAYMLVEFPELEMECSIRVRAWLEDIYLNQMMREISEKDPKNKNTFRVCPPILESTISWVE